MSEGQGMGKEVEEGDDEVGSVCDEEEGMEQGIGDDCKELEIVGILKVD